MCNYGCLSASDHSFMRTVSVPGSCCARTVVVGLCVQEESIPTSCVYHCVGLFFIRIVSFVGSNVEERHDDLCRRPSARAPVGTATRNGE